MNYTEYSQYFKKYVELRDQNMNREAYELNKPLVEELGVIEASQIQNTAEWDYALLKAKRYTETKAQLTKEELEDVLITISHQMTAKLFKELYRQDRLSLEAIKSSLVEVYTDSDGFDQMFFLPLFKKVKEEDGVLLVREEDVKRYESLPDKVVIYRGMREGESVKNKLSYTLSFDTAELFAYRHSVRTNKGVVISTEVKKSDILALITGEDEVIMDPVNLGEITIVQDNNGPTNRPYVDVTATTDDDSDTIVLYRASDEETYQNCYDCYNWSDLDDGWSIDRKRAEKDILSCESEGEEGMVVIAVEINKKYLSEYDKSNQTYTIDIEKALEEDEDFEEPNIIFVAEEVKYKNNLPEKVKLFTFVEREEYEEAVKGEREWTDVLYGWWNCDRSVVEESVRDDYDEDENVVILSTEISKDYIFCRKTNCGFSIRVDVESAMKDGNFVVPHIVEK